MRLVLVAAGIGLIIGLFGTPWLIRILSRHGYAQAIRDESHGHYPAHDNKRGTPSMGGVMIVAGTLIGYAGAHLYTMRAPSPSGLLVLFLMAGLGAVGFVDDYIKIFRQRSAGIRASVKLGGQIVVAVAFGAACVGCQGRRGAVAGLTCGLVRPGHPIVLPAGLFIVWVLAMVVATSNGVNLTDGLDGLATGTCVMVLGAYVVIGVWQFGNACSSLQARTATRSRTRSTWQSSPPAPWAHASASSGGMPRRPRSSWVTPDPWRWAACSPASRSCRAPSCSCSILGGLFVLITTSVILQVGGYKLTKKRVFLMAPLQHHFELKGWGEVTIVIRFWVIAGLCVGLGLGLFYAEWVGGGAVG